MRIMYDSVTPGNIPADAEMVAGYVDPGGSFTWSEADWARFPNAVKVHIAGWASTNDGHVLDVEDGDATPEQAPAWVTMRRAAGVSPTVYCSEAVWQAVKNQFAAQGVAEPQWWIAGYPGSVGAENLYPGSVAHQYQDVGPYDISSVADHWPGIDDQEDDMAQEDINRINGALFGDVAFGGSNKGLVQQVNELTALLEGNAAFGQKPLADVIAEKLATPTVDVAALAAALAAALPARGPMNLSGSFTGAATPA